MVEEQIRTEIVEKRYKVTYEKPTIISALGAIKKSNGNSVRLIQAQSVPETMPAPV